MAPATTTGRSTAADVAGNASTTQGGLIDNADLRQAEAYVRRYPFLNRIALPEGAFDLAKNLPAANVQVVGPTVELLARDGLNRIFDYVGRNPAGKTYQGYAERLSRTPGFVGVPESRWLEEAKAGGTVRRAFDAAGFANDEVLQFLDPGIIELGKLRHASRQQRTTVHDRLDGSEIRYAQ